MNNDTPTTREGIQLAALDLKRAAAKNGHQMTHSQAVERVTRAVEQGDRKREER